MIEESKLKTCVETINEAIHEYLAGAPSAVEGDGFGAMAEAKRNLIALVQWFHGDDAWRRAQDW